MSQCRPVIIGPMSPVVSVVAVLVVRPFPGGAVVAVAPRAAVRVSVAPPVRVVILVAMLVVGVVPVSLPRLIAVSWVHVLAVPLPVSSVWNTVRFFFSLKEKMRFDICLAKVPQQSGRAAFAFCFIFRNVCA